VHTPKVRWVESTEAIVGGGDFEMLRRYSQSLRSRAFDQPNPGMLPGPSSPIYTPGCQRPNPAPCRIIAEELCSYHHWVNSLVFKGCKPQMMTREVQHTSREANYSKHQRIHMQGKNLSSGFQIASWHRLYIGLFKHVHLNSSLMGIRCSFSYFRYHASPRRC